MKAQTSFSLGRLSRPWNLLTGALILGAQFAEGIELSIDDPSSIKKATKLVAKDLMSFYTGHRPGDVPGNLPAPYYWWEAGAMFGSMVDYWYYTGDDTYNEKTTQALQFQVGPKNDFMPPNQTSTEGNDDQAFWGLAAMSAAENKYPDPPDDQPQWLALAQAVFNTQAVRWDNQTCRGGLRWQIFSFNNGYNYKNTISNGCFFNLAARLAMYTDNRTYYEWADTMYDWTENIGLMTDKFQFYDGTDATNNCTTVNRIQWSYNAGNYLIGAANMYNYTKGAEQDKWKQRVTGILNATSVFFDPKNVDVMYEVACENNGKCNVDQRSFKAYLSRWMAATTKVAPFTADFIMPKLRTSALAAAKTCTGGASGNFCGQKWTTGSFDNSMGVGEQMCALEVMQSNLIGTVAGPVTNKTGGTSKGDPSAGTGGDTVPDTLSSKSITTGDRVGAGFLTTLIIVGVIGGAAWMIVS
ncbi:MAG: hypothetical protein M1825_002638 [Sarcosagium campestre]|nr:MAG: hypothetical protein M1825_002638 [Sarcosagium campestre]